MRELIESITHYHHIRRVEKVYSNSLNFIKENLEETSSVFRRLPDKIIVETIYVEGKPVRSLILSFLRKVRIPFRKQRYVKIIIPTNMNYHEQIAYIIKQVFDEVLALDNVLSYELKNSLICYYAYKFAKTSREILDKNVINILEKDFQNSKYRDIIVRLDSKELEKKITLNPPPEVKPLLDRVIIPILELKNRELSKISELARLEEEKSKIEKILKLLGNGFIGILFIGKRNPEEYLSYIDEKIYGFHGLLVCSRGKYTIFFKNDFYKILKSKIEKYLGEIIEERFEGYIDIPEHGKIYYLYNLFLEKNFI